MLGIDTPKQILQALYWGKPRCHIARVDSIGGPSNLSWSTPRHSNAGNLTPPQKKCLEDCWFHFGMASFRGSS